MPWRAAGWRQLILPTASRSARWPATSRGCGRRLCDCIDLGEGMRVARADLPASSFLPDLRLQPLSRHLLWSGPWACSNFYVVLSDSGKAMFVDYGHSLSTHMHTGPDHSGFESMRFVVHHLDELRDDYGVTDFDLVVPTHIHDDHVCGIPYLQRHHGTRCWALHEVAQVLEEPAAWASTPCTIPKPIRVDRHLRDGESFTWEEYRFDIYHAPGQTEFHSVYAGNIDGRQVAFTGDNFFMGEVMRAGSTLTRPYQTTVLRNSFQLAMHRRCVEVMRKLTPELICPGHRDVIDCSKQQLDEYADFIARKERVFRNLVAAPADHYVDLFWALLRPYLATVRPGGTIEYRLMLRNNWQRPVTFTAQLQPPPGWQRAAAGTLLLAAGERGELPLQATAPARGDGIRRLLTAQIAVDGEPLGPIAEALVTVTRGLSTLTWLAPRHSPCEERTIDERAVLSPDALSRSCPPTSGNAIRPSGWISIRGCSIRCAAAPCTMTTSMSWRTRRAWASTECASTSTTPTATA